MGAAREAETTEYLVATARTLALAARVVERSVNEMTLPQFRVLGLIASSPERASHVAERAAMSRPTLTGILDGLEARDWVRRGTVGADRRGVQLEVTPAGLAALATAERAAAGGVDDLLTDLNPEERRAVLTGCAILATALERRSPRRLVVPG